MNINQYHINLDFKFFNHPRLINQQSHNKDIVEVKILYQKICIQHKLVVAIFRRNQKNFPCSSKSRASSSFLLFIILFQRRSVIQIVSCTLRNRHFLRLSFFSLQQSFNILFYSQRWLLRSKPFVWITLMIYKEFGKVP